MTLVIVNNTKKKQPAALKVKNTDLLNELFSHCEKTDRTNELFVRLAHALTPATKEGKIRQILNLYRSGKTKGEIILLGYSKSTVHKQIKEYSTKKTFAIEQAILDEEGENEEEEN